MLRRSVLGVAVLLLIAACASSNEVTITGHLFDDGGGLRLCDALMESFPPQCAEGVPLENPASVDLGDLQTSGGVTWSDHAVTVIGTEEADGTVVIKSVGLLESG